jgi:malate dehydrogenase (oxaloacetate-decarboxylating)
MAPKKGTRRTNTRPHEFGEEALALHKRLKGKIEVIATEKLTKESAPLLYTPGVGAVSRYLSEHPTDMHEFCSKTVAIVSDGSAVLGLGNVGPEAAMPVMEGKALLFKELAGVNAVPIVLQTQDTDEIVQTIKAIAPTFAGINIEDIAAPRCFAIERRLTESLSIPVMHDDQHGTAIVVLAGLMNAFTVAKKSLKSARIAVIGAGAAGNAVARILIDYGVGDVVVVDRHGILSSFRTDIDEEKQALASVTNTEQRTGGVLESMAGADAVVAVSGPGSLNGNHVRMMAQRPIVFALANPVPEVSPEEARAAGAIVVATGRSDYPNQVNNALVFPGVFRGALENHVERITPKMKLRAARALAGLVKRPTASKILPTLFDRRVVKTVAGAIHD